MNLYNIHIDAVKQRKKDGLSNREIARLVGVHHSTIGDWLKKSQQAQELEALPEIPEYEPAPKVLLLDVETAPVKAWVWRMFKENIGLNQIETDWHLLSYSAKWLGKNDIYYRDQRNQTDIENDCALLDDLWCLLDDADIVITQNGKKFDIPKIRARMVIMGYQPFSPVRHIDTWQIAKKTFGFTSNKLAYMSEVLCPETAKSDHKKFPGFELWKECLAGNPEAWEEMELYNKQDIISLEGVYHALSPWADALPVFSTYSDENKFTCNCGSDNIIEVGTFCTDVSRFTKYRCECCGKHYRGRKNLLSKEKRNSLLTNARES